MKRRGGKTKVRERKHLDNLLRYGYNDMVGGLADFRRGGSVKPQYQRIKSYHDVLIRNDPMKKLQVDILSSRSKSQNLRINMNIYSLLSN